MFMEIHTVAVLEDVWNRVKRGDEAAIEQLKDELNGIEIYMHALSADAPPYTWVTLKELNEANIVEAVVLRTR